LEEIALSKSTGTESQQLPAKLSETQNKRLFSSGGRESKSFLITTHITLQDPIVQDSTGRHIKRLQFFRPNNQICCKLEHERMENGKIPSL